MNKNFIDHKVLAKMTISDHFEVVFLRGAVGSLQF